MQDERLGFDRQLAMNGDNRGREANGEGAGREWVWAGAAREGAGAAGGRVEWPRVEGGRGRVAEDPRSARDSLAFLWEQRMGRGGPRWADGGRGLRPGKSDGREDGNRTVRRPDWDQ